MFYHKVGHLAQLRPSSMYSTEQFFIKERTLVRKDSSFAREAARYRSRLPCTPSCRSRCKLTYEGRAPWEKGLQSACLGIESQKLLSVLLCSPRISFPVLVATLSMKNPRVRGKTSPPLYIVYSLIVCSRIRTIDGGGASCRVQDWF